MGPVGFPEMLAIFVIALLLFGPKKLPELGRTLGKAISEFRRAKNVLKTTFESHLQELERETRASETSSPAPPHYSADYSYPYEDYNHYNPESSDYSAPSKIASTEEVHAELPPATGDLASTGEASTDHESVPALPPVSGTVARTNGARSLEENVKAPQQEHPV